jgi:hypothetical protein
LKALTDLAGNTKQKENNMNTKQLTWPTIQEQIDHWNAKERLEHERVMDIRAESRDATNETREGLRALIGLTVSADHALTCLNPDKTFVIRHVKAEHGNLYVRGENTMWFHGGLIRLALPQIPAGNASTTAETLTQEEIVEREEATCEIYDERERNWSLRDAGSNDGEGESYAARQL